MSKVATLAELAFLSEAFEGAALHPDLVPEFSKLGRRWMRTGRRAEGVEALKLSVMLHPHSAEARLTLADAQLLLGDPAKAEVLYREVLSTPEGPALLSADYFQRRANRLQQQPMVAASRASKALLKLGTLILSPRPNPPSP